MKGEKGDQLAGKIQIIQTSAFYILLLFLLHFFHCFGTMEMGSVFNKYIGKGLKDDKS